MNYYFGVLFVLISTVTTVRGQIAAWPATSYSPYFDAVFKAAASPVLAMNSGPGLQAPAIPIPSPVFAIPSRPIAAAQAPVYAPSPIYLAPPATIFAPSAGYYVPKVVPHGVFGRPAVSYGTRKA